MKCLLNTLQTHINILININHLGSIKLVPQRNRTSVEHLSAVIGSQKILNRDRNALGNVYFYLKTEFSSASLLSGFIQDKNENTEMWQDF